jgi:hypothetical protein
MTIPPRIKYRIHQAIPAPIKHRLRQVISGRQGKLLRAGVELEKQARAGAVSDEVLAEMRAAWSNDWAPELPYLSALVERLLDAREDCLECGSGLTTLIAGAVAEARGVRVWSLEQDAGWCRVVARELQEFGLDSVTLWHAPLRNYGEFTWYDLGARVLPLRFSYVFCDGPAVIPGTWPADVYGRWRMGVVPVLQGLNIPFEEILLHDGDDPRAPELISQWAACGVRTRAVDAPGAPLIVGRPDHAMP